MSNEKMREEFEVWLRTRPEVLNIGYVTETGRYLLREDQERWEAWKASRQLMVIELPHFVGAFPETQNYVRSECKKAIEAAGVKVKA